MTKCWATLALAVALTASCGQTDGRTASQESAVAVDDLVRNDAAVVDYAAYSINYLATQAESAVIGTVTGLSSVKWNGPPPTGSAPSAESEAPPPLPYREATVRVDRVVFGSGRAVEIIGSSNVLRLSGDGTDTGARLGLAPEVRYNRSGGDVSVGDSVLLLLAPKPFPQQDGSTITALTPVNGYQSVWTIKGARAVSVDPLRTVPLSELLAKLAVERARGLLPVPDGDVSARNPLAITLAPTPSASFDVPCFGPGCGQ